MGLVNRILVATDLSDHAEVAFTYGAELAVLARAPMVLLHIYATPLLYFAGEPIAAAAPPDVDDLRASLDQAMTALANRGRALGISDVQVAVTGGDAADEIVRVAVDRRCDLIVMGTHGRTGVKRLVLGSVADKVVRHARCPVLTVRSPS